jgi:3-hydroxyisobutyrate dehydrogenase-like beta-hydroxyacid dehydrogenase
MHVGFLDLGAIGAPMAAHLARRGGHARPIRLTRRQSGAELRG